MSEDTKKCSRCQKTKIQHLDFYMCQGKYRSECKTCTIKKNSKYQKEKRSWLLRDLDDTKTKDYMREYRKKNKEKFKTYRESFLKKNPGYTRDYYLENKDKKSKSLKKGQYV